MPDIVMQTTAVVAHHLTPLIEKGICQIVRQGDQQLFTMIRGSAEISVFVQRHPRIEDDALVQVIGLLGMVTPEKLSVPLLAQALMANSVMHGYAIALAENGMLCLRGTLIGSTMDELEFTHLLTSLADSADALDDKFAALFSAATATDQDEKAGSALENLKHLTTELQGIIAKHEEELLSNFSKFIDADQRTELERLMKDAEVRAAIKAIAFGKQAAALVALAISGDLTDETRKTLGREILDSMPEVPLLLELLFFTVMSITKSMAAATDTDIALIQERLKVILGQD